MNSPPFRIDANGIDINIACLAKVMVITHNLGRNIRNKVKKSSKILTGAKNFDNFCVSFDRYYESFISGKKTGQ